MRAALGLAVHLSELVALLVEILWIFVWHGSQRRILLARWRSFRSEVRHG